MSTSGTPGRAGAGVNSQVPARIRFQSFGDPPISSPGLVVLGLPAGGDGVTRASTCTGMVVNCMPAASVGVRGAGSGGGALANGTNFAVGAVGTSTMASVLALAFGGDAAEGPELLELELELELELLAVLVAFAAGLGVVAPLCGAAGRMCTMTSSSAFSSAGLSSGPAATAGVGSNTTRR